MKTKTSCVRVSFRSQHLQVQSGSRCRSPCWCWTDVGPGQHESRRNGVRPIYSCGLNMGGK